MLWFSNPGIIGKEETQLIFRRIPITIVETRFDCLKLAYGSEIHSRGSYVCGCGLIFLAWVVVDFILVVVGWL